MKTTSDPTLELEELEDFWGYIVLGGGWLGGGVAPVFHDDSPWFFPVGFVDFSYFLIDRPPPILCAGYFWCREFSEARSGALGVTPPLTTRRTGCLFFHGFFRWPWQLVTYHHIINCIENIYLVYRWFKPPRKGHDMLQTPRIRKNASWNSPLDGPSRKEMWLHCCWFERRAELDSLVWESSSVQANPGWWNMITGFKIYHAWLPMKRDNGAS